MIRLTLGSRDAASFRLVFALEELGIAYALQPIDLMALEQWNAQHRAGSSIGAVPLLEVPGSALEASDLALFYLAETKPEAGLTFTDPLTHYDCQESIFALDNLLGESGNLVGWMQTTGEAEQQHYLAALSAIPDRPILSGWTAVIRDATPPAERPPAALEKLRQGLSHVAKLLGERDWLIGDHFSVADIAGFSLLHQLGDLLPAGEGPADLPAIAAWMERVQARPGYARAVSRLDEAGVHVRFSPPKDDQ